MLIIGLAAQAPCRCGPLSSNVRALDMLKLIGILVLSTQLSVAVETGSGYSEASFPNSAAGAEQLIEYAEKKLGQPEDGVHIVVGWLDDKDNDEHIIKALDSLGIKHALATPTDIQAAIAENKLSAQSPTAVALAFKKRFAFLWQSKPK